MRRRRADGLFDEIATFGALCAASSRAALGKRRGPSGTGGSRLAGSRSRGPDRPPGARNRNTAGNRNNNQGFRVSSTPQKPEPARSRPRRASVGASRAGHDEPAPLVERGGVTAGAVLGPRGRRASGRPFLRAAAFLTGSGFFAFPRQVEVCAPRRPTRRPAAVKSRPVDLDLGCPPSPGGSSPSPTPSASSKSSTGLSSPAATSSSSSASRPPGPRPSCRPSAPR